MQENFECSAEVLEENNFYPFGLKHEGYNAQTGNSSYNYQYNGKELQKETGWSDYGARMYMADIGRWGVLDPLAESTTRVSPYNYALNNPVMFVDPDSRKAYNPEPVTSDIPRGGLLDFFGNGGYTQWGSYEEFIGKDVFGYSKKGSEGVYGGESSAGTAVTYDEAIAFLYFGNIDFSQFTGGDPQGNALSRFRDRTSNWVQDNIREPLSGWFDNNTRNIFTLDAAGQARMDDMRSQMSGYMNSTVGGGIKWGAEHGLVGSGLETGNVGAFIKRWKTTSDNNFVGKLATRLGRIVKAVDQPFKFEGGAGDVDIVTSLYNIEVKSGNKMKITQSLKNLNYAKSLDKKYILYMPNATDRQIFDASKKGITVVKSENILKNLIKR